MCSYGQYEHMARSCYLFTRVTSFFHSNFRYSLLNASDSQLHSRSQKSRTRSTFIMQPSLPLIPHTQYLLQETNTFSKGKHGYPMDDHSNLYVYRITVSTANVCSYRIPVRTWPESFTSSGFLSSQISRCDIDVLVFNIGILFSSIWIIYSFWFAWRCIHTH